MERLYKIRSILGVILIALIYARYEKNDSFNQVAKWMVDDAPKVVLAVNIQIVVFGALVVVFLTETGYRWVAFKQFWWPFQAALMFGALTAATEFAYGAFHGAVTAQQSGDQGSTLTDAVFLLVYSVTGLLWCIACIGLAWGLCRASDAHPLLGPVVATCTVWYFTMAANLTTPVDYAIPPLIRLLMGYGAPASITFLSILEVYWLAKDYSGVFPFRRGPLTPTLGA